MKNEFYHLETHFYDFVTSKYTTLTYLNNKPLSQRKFFSCTTLMPTDEDNCKNPFEICCYNNNAYLQES